MRASLYFILFLVTYLAIRFTTDRMGWDLPGTFYVTTAEGVVGVQLVQIVAANVIAAAVMKGFDG